MLSWVTTRDDCGLNLQIPDPPPPAAPVADPRKLGILEYQGDGSIQPGDRVRLYWSAGIGVYLGPPVEFTYPEFVYTSGVLAGKHDVSKGTALNTAVTYSISFSTPNSAAMRLAATLAIGPPTSRSCILEAVTNEVAWPPQ